MQNDDYTINIFFSEEFQTFGYSDFDNEFEFFDKETSNWFNLNRPHSERFNEVSCYNDLKKVGVPVDIARGVERTLLANISKDRYDKVMEGHRIVESYQNA